MTETSPANAPAKRVPIAILGVPFDNVNAAETLALIGEMVAARRPHYAATVGIDFLAWSREDVELRRILFDAHLVLAGEKQIVRAAKILGNPLPESLGVEQLVPQLLSTAEKNGWRVFFLGGTITEAALAEKIKAKYPKLNIAGIDVPPVKPLLEMDQRDILRRIREARPDILLVAFGFNKQEKWISMNSREAKVPFSLGVGEGWEAVTGEPLPSRRAKNGWKFNLALLRQWRRMRAKKSAPPAAERKAEMDSFGNLIIRTPERLGAAEVQKSQTEWLQAVERGHVIFDLSDTIFCDSTGIGFLIRLRKRARELGYQYYLISPRPPIEAALKMMKLDEFFSIQTSLNGAYILLENAISAPLVSSGVKQTELQIRWVGEVTALNATELGMHTESELSQASPGMTVLIDMARVTFVDSTGIGLMVRFKKNLQRQGMVLRYVNVAASVRNVLQHTQLEEFLLGEN